MCEVLLSIRVLTQTLRLLCPFISRRRAYRKDVQDGFVRPSLIPLYDKMTPERGWCPHQRDHYCETLSIVSLHYLCSIKRKAVIEHNACKSESLCVAYNISDDFKGRHVHDGCSCEGVAAGDIGILIDILKRGAAAIVIASREAHGAIELRYAEAAPGMVYTAISHLWFDGLGDPKQNSLPQCQLESILTRIWSANQGQVDVGTELGGGRQELSSLKIDGVDILCKPLAFWLDIYCIPASNSHEDVEILRLKAINRLASTYRFAQHVLIFDSGLHQLSPSLSKTEIVANILLCGWRSRLWTHQELCMARSPLLQLAEGAVVPYPCTPRFQSQQEDYGEDYDAPTASIADMCETLLLSELELANSHAEAGFENGEEEQKNERQEDFFGRIWNTMVGKASSTPEDMLGIFANMLTLSVSEIRKQRIKAIFASYGTIPIGVLLDVESISAEAVQKRVKATQTKSRDERWVPLLPTARGMFHSQKGLSRPRG